MRLTYIWLAMIAAYCALAGVARAADDDGYAWSDKQPATAGSDDTALQDAVAAADDAAADAQAAAADAAPVQDVGAPDLEPVDAPETASPPPPGEEVRPGEEVLPAQPALAPAPNGKHRLRNEYKQWCGDHGFADSPDKHAVKRKSAGRDYRLYAARNSDARSYSRQSDDSRDREYADTAKSTSDRGSYHVRDYDAGEERAADRMADERIYDDSDRRDLDDDRYWSRSRLDGYYVGEQRQGCGCHGCAGKSSKCSKCGRCSDRCGKCRAKAGGCSQCGAKTSSCSKCGARMVEEPQPEPASGKCGGKRRKCHRC